MVRVPAFAGTTWVIAVSALQIITGTIVLAGAGKMGSAMLSGWLAQGLAPKRVAVIEPQLQTGAMPIANLTGMTDAERAALLDWIHRGAPH